MSAIIPHLEQQDDPSVTPTEREWFAAIDQETLQTSGLGRMLGRAARQPDVASHEWLGELRNDALQVSHAELLRVTWLRQIQGDALRGLTMKLRPLAGNVRVDLFNAKGEPVRVTDPPWNPTNNMGGSLLGWTSKMAAPSFSIPAGPPTFGGACPGALGAQSIVPANALAKGMQHAERVLQKPVELGRCVCQWCYATGGNYAYATKQMQQVIAYAWARAAVKDGSFVEIMDWAVKNADYYLDGAKDLPPERKFGGERTRKKFFRIHDSGDFYDRHYLAAWKAVAELNPDVTFWAPTRIYATPWGVASVDEVNGPGGDNLIIRPSAYMVDDPPPAALQDREAHPGWAGWTVVYDKDGKPLAGPGPHPPGSAYNWDCQAYAVVEEDHNCRKALAPDKKMGCRACWRRDEMIINYTKH